MPSSRGFSKPKDQTQLSLIASRFFTIWATRDGVEDKTDGVKDLIFASTINSNAVGYCSKSYYYWILEVFQPGFIYMGNHEDSCYVPSNCWLCFLSDEVATDWVVQLVPLTFKLMILFLVFILNLNLLYLCFQAFQLNIEKCFTGIYKPPCTKQINYLTLIDKIWFLSWLSVTVLKLE